MTRTRTKSASKKTTRTTDKKNTALRSALREYDEIERRYVSTLQGMGLKFAPAHAADDEIASLRAQLRDAGAVFRNAGASILAGGDGGTGSGVPWLSYACEVCTGPLNSETFSTTFECHRDCYFCFNRNQADYEKFFEEGCPWEAGVTDAQKRYDDLAVIGLTGGEPLLNLDDSIRFLDRVNGIWPNAHKRMYTSGDLLTEEGCKRLAATGLREIRFSVKVEDSGALQESVLSNMELAKRYIPDVVVEMPIIPGTEEKMRELFTRWDEIGIRGVNMLEFCFPFCKWEEFDKRGFILRNPPFEVMYDFGYSGGLAVAGSEELCLKMMLYGIEQGVSFGMHYCSLENKHRSEMRQRNERAAHVNPAFSFDDGDMYLKTAKVFGPDIAPARAKLLAAGCEHILGGEDEGCLVFPICYLATLEDADITPAISTNIIETDEHGSFIKEIGLRAV